jgi:hypothetical protein
MSSDVDEQCESVWGGLRCELIAGHASAHGTRTGQALVTWVNHASITGRNTPTEWVTIDDESRSARETR